MNIIRICKIFLRFFTERDRKGLICRLKFKYGIPLPHDHKYRWESNVGSEIQFWDNFFKTEGLKWPHRYLNMIDPDLPLQERVVELLPPKEKYRILDVGAGPLTCLGKQYKGRSVEIVAIDPLADEYNKLLVKYNIHTLVKTINCAGEKLTSMFPPNSFDLVYAHNSIDHAIDPELVLKQMISVVKRGHYILLEHFPNEGSNEEYFGLHQWNLSTSSNGDFLLSSKFSQKTNLTRKLKDLCTINCEIVKENTDIDWLITRIKKE